MTNERTPRPESEGPGGASTIRIPAYPTGGDPRRRRALHERLYLRRRNARAFDAAAGRPAETVEISTVSQSAEPYEGDWWLDIGMPLGVEERERAGGGA